MRKYLETAPLNEVIRFSPTEGYKTKSVAFEGTPRKHPFESDHIILIPDPMNQATEFFDFRIDEILHVDELPNIATPGGDNIRIVRLWIKKGALALAYRAFEVTG